VWWGWGRRHRHTKKNREHIKGKGKGADEGEGADTDKQKTKENRLTVTMWVRVRAKTRIDTKRQKRASRRSVNKNSIGAPRFSYNPTHHRCTMIKSYTVYITVEFLYYVPCIVLDILWLTHLFR
jgi:hypothetical protein